MSVTTTQTQTLQTVLDRANPNQLGDALSLVRLARMLDPVKITLTGITASATVNLPTFLKGVSTLTINDGLTGLATNDPLPAILIPKTIRVTTSGTANSVGTYVVSDAGGTATSPTASTVAGIALLSDDGTTLTFPTTITGLVLEYIPRSYTDFATVYPAQPTE